MNAPGRYHVSPCAGCACIPPRPGVCCGSSLGHLSHVRAGSAYPSTVSVIADMAASRPRANSGCEQSQQTAQLFDQLVGAQQE
jgi:hypothetical protein